LSKIVYNTQHLPLTVTDAAGKTTTNIFNARGQLLTTTNPKGETTTYYYETNGYLLSVDGPLPGTNDTATATYDSFGRLRTKTDESGYTLTYNYDSLNRRTNITFPDGTFAQFTFDKLDATVVRDRAGRLTTMEFNSMRQMTKRTDASNRTTHFEWCSCGDLRSLTDPLGRTTWWYKDVQVRLFAKKEGEGASVNYFYENATSRLRQMVDEKQQVSQFTYNRDDMLNAVAYVNAQVPTPGVSYTYDPNYSRLTS